MEIRTIEGARNNGEKCWNQGDMARNAIIRKMDRLKTLNSVSECGLDGRFH